MVMVTAEEDKLENRFVWDQFTVALVQIAIYSTDQ